MLCIPLHSCRDLQCLILSYDRTVWMQKAHNRFQFETVTSVLLQYVVLDAWNMSEVGQNSELMRLFA